MTTATPVATKEAAPMKIEDIAEKYGIDPTKLRKRMQDFAKIKAKEGLVVDTDIGYKRLIIQMSQGDMGVELSEEELKYISLGHQRLFPKEIMNKVARLEGRGRSNLEKHSFTFEEGRFVPATAWEDWKAENARLKNEFFEVRDEIVRDYDAIIVEVRKDLVERARAVFKRASADHARQSPTSEWVSQFVNRLLVKIPSKGDLRDSFYWKEKFKWLRMPSEIEEDLLRETQIRADRVAVQHESDDRKKKIESMNDDFVQQLREEKKKAHEFSVDFVWQAAKTQREAIAKCLSQALSTIKRNGGRKLSGSTIKALKSMVERSKSLNFFDDPEVNESIGKLDHWLSKAPRRRSVQLFKRQATQIATMMQGSVRALEDENTRQEEVCRIVGQDLIESVRSVE